MGKKRSALPTKTSKGRRFDVEVALTAWLDLLGYGSMLRAARFNPLAVEAKAAVGRLRRFHNVVEQMSHPLFPMLLVNDAVAAFRDPSKRSNSVTYDFLKRCVNLHAAVNRADRALKYPGARMVVAAGFRMRLRRSASSRGYKDPVQQLLNKIASKQIGVQTAVHQAARRRIHFAVVPELAANFAFAKAYLAEQSGTRGGLPGPEIYIDLALFDEAPPNWIDLSVIHWRHEGLSADFARVNRVDWKEGGRQGQAGVLDAFGIARRLTGDTQILRQLKQGT